MSISRRRLLLGGMSLAAWVAAGALAGCGSDPAVPPPLVMDPLPPDPLPVAPAFVQPSIRQSAAGQLDTTLNIAIGNFQVDGQAAQLRCYDNALVGPTLRFKPGDQVKIQLSNSLPTTADQNVMPANENVPHAFNNSNLHTHGLHVSPEGFSDNIFVDLQPGQQWPYQYSIPHDHPPGTHWYHPHKHGSSSMQLFSGMAGALLIQGGLDEVPEIQAARDLVYLIQELNLDNSGQVPNYTGQSFPLNQRKLLINGAFQPTLKAFAGEVVRLRVINASVRTNVPLAVDNHDLHVLAFDGITLPQVQTASTVFLPPAGRSEVLLRCQGVGLHAIKKLVDNNNQNPDNEVILGFLEVLPEQVSMALPSLLPAPSNLPNITDGEITQNRSFTFKVSSSGGPPGFSAFTINDQLFDKNNILTINLGAVEEWTLINESNVGHPFHIHINPFQVMSINDVPLNPPEWRDTVLIPKNGGKVVIRHRFEDFKGLYVFHCHILPHEDIGMMQVVNVI